MNIVEVEEPMLGSRLSTIFKHLALVRYTGMCVALTHLALSMHTRVRCVTPR